MSTMFTILMNEYTKVYNEVAEEASWFDDPDSYIEAMFFHKMVKKNNFPEKVVIDFLHSKYVPDEDDCPFEQSCFDKDIFNKFATM